MDGLKGLGAIPMIGIAALVLTSGCDSSQSDDAQMGDQGGFPGSGGQTFIGAGGGVAIASPAGGMVGVAGTVGAGGAPIVVGAGGTPIVGAGGAPLGGAGGTAGASGGAGAAGAAGTAAIPWWQTSGGPAIPDLVVNMSGTIQPGAEAMFCMLYQMPTTGKTAVPSAESHYTAGSHHFLIFRTSLTSIPAGENVGHICGAIGNTTAVTGQSNGMASAESVQGQTGSYYEAQVPDSRRDLPPGVAHVFAPGEILDLTAHYLNTGVDTIDSKIEFRMHLMNAADVKYEAGTFFLLDTSLNIPPNSQVTAAKACPIPKDINLGLLWSHMHARGYSFRAWTDDMAATQQLGGDVYDQPGPDGWAEPHIQSYPYDPPITLHAGSKLNISCTYRNTTSKTFTFGQSAATAEMCLLHGMYWPRLDGSSERCAAGTTLPGMSGPIPAGM